MRRGHPEGAQLQWRAGKGYHSGVLQGKALEVVVYGAGRKAAATAVPPPTQNVSGGWFWNDSPRTGELDKYCAAASHQVLVLDKFTKDVIAPLLRLNDLRKHGVTLHLMLEAERQPIPDVPAVYLVTPSPPNVERIAADAAGSLYDSMYLNFTVPIPGKLVEQLAAGVVKAGALSRVSKLYDQYISFIALEPSLFSLGQPETYIELNDPQARDYQIEVGAGGAGARDCRGSGGRAAGQGRANEAGAVAGISVGLVGANVDVRPPCRGRAEHIHVHVSADRPPCPT